MQTEQKIRLSARLSEVKNRAAHIWKNKYSRRRIGAGFLLLLGNVLFFLTLWILQKYDKVSFDQFLFQMKASSAGVHRDLAGSAVIRVGLFSIIAAAAEVLIYGALSGQSRKALAGSAKYFRYKKTKICGFFKGRAMLLSAGAFTFGLVFFTSQLDVPAYIEATATASGFIEENYVNPVDVQMTFPEKKRNLIYIFLESMESTYADTSAGGRIIDNYIPELTALAEENISFSNTDGIGGARGFYGTTWTAASLVAQTSGLPVKIPAAASPYGGENIFLPGAFSIGEILEREGYNQELLIGSEGEFHGRKAYFMRHGGYTVTDINAIKEQGRLDEGYEEWWGFEDEKLFDYAKEELAQLAAQDAPFNLTMLTADTHFPAGYVCRLCEDRYEEQYANVISCSSRQLAAFIGWLKEQPYYEDTTIVLCGDHLTMDPDFLEDINEDYVRTIYNCIINSAADTESEKNREFGVFDMFPTTLAAMGVSIEGERLGLGTNLFSGVPTLAEQYGAEELDSQLQKKSKFYNKKLLYGKEE